MGWGHSILGGKTPRLYWLLDRGVPGLYRLLGRGVPGLHRLALGVFQPFVQPRRSSAEQKNRSAPLFSPLSTPDSQYFAYLCATRQQEPMAKVHLTPEGWRCEKTGKHLYRAKWMDYRSPSIQLLTMVTTDRMPLLGDLRGEQIVRTALSQRVAEEIERIPSYLGASSIEIYNYVVMPDHVHILLRIHDRLPKHIGQYVRWFKYQCDKACQALAVIPANKQACLFAPEYHDRILTGRNQLAHMTRYIKDNPSRMALKRANRDLFRIRQNVTLGDIPCTALGNIFLADYPQRQVLQCSRRMTSEQIKNHKTECLAEAANGMVFITAAISEGEKQIARAHQQYPRYRVIAMTPIHHRDGTSAPSR